MQDKNSKFENFLESTQSLGDEKAGRLNNPRLMPQRTSRQPANPRQRTSRQPANPRQRTSRQPANPRQRSTPRQSQRQSTANTKRTPQLVKIAVAAVAALVLVVVYATGVSKYTEEYFPNTHAFGIELTELSPFEAQLQAQVHLATYSLHISGYGVDSSIKATDISLHYESSNAAQDVLNAQNAYLWPIMIFLEHDVSASFNTTFNEESLTATVTGIVDAHNTTSADATTEKIAFNSTTKLWEYVAASNGEDLDAASVVEQATTAVSQQQTELEIPASCLIQSTTGGEDMKDVIEVAAARANELCAQYSIEVTLADTTTFSIDAAQAAQWISISETYDVSIDEGKVEEWLSSLRNLLSSATERTFTRPDGKVCTVEGGDYFWQASDPDAAIEQIRQALKQGTGSVDNISCTTVGNGFLGVNGADWGARFCDVDITEQHARFYSETGELIWETDVITGLEGTSYETPTGVYTITEKLSPASLRSYGTYTYLDDNGEWQTEENHQYGRDVEYWMPFVGTFIGLHDAWWQTSFGGDLYKDVSYGSGGCVNLPTDKAAELYEMIQVGDVVVVHY